MSKKVYRTGKLQQLIDLNEDLINFKLKFTLNSKNGEEFLMAIADQYTIDNNPNEIEFKKIKNTISGTITSDKNVFQNHFLILKSVEETEAEVEVLIQKKEITPSQEAEQVNNQMREQVREQVNNQVRSQEVNQHEEELREQLRNQELNQYREQMREQEGRKIEQENYVKDDESTTWIDLKLIIIIIICILIGIFIYNFVSKKSGITNNLNDIIPKSDTGFNQALFGKLNKSIPI